MDLVLKNVLILIIGTILSSETTSRIMADQVILMVASLCNLKNDYAVQ